MHSFCTLLLTQSCRISRAETVDEAFFRYWEELKLLQTVDEKEISTVLLIFPEIDLFGNYEIFEAYCDGLSDSLSSATGMGMELEFQLVFFHPKYTFRDGNARLEEEKGAANFARRGPWPMINILRTNQVRAAQKVQRIPYHCLVDRHILCSH